MLNNKIVMLITTARKDDGSFGTVFFDRRDETVKIKRHSAADWQNQLDTNRAVIFLGPAVIGGLASFFPNVLEGQWTFYFIIALFFVIGIIVGYLLIRDLNTLSRDTRVDVIFDSSEFLRGQTKRLILQIMVVTSLLVISALFAGYFFLLILVSGISIVNIVFFVMASFVFWSMMFQGLLGRVRTYYSLINER